MVGPGPLSARHCRRWSFWWWRLLFPKAYNRPSIASTPTIIAHSVTRAVASTPYSRWMLANRPRATIQQRTMASAYTVHNGTAKETSFTPTAMGRWSVLNKSLPEVSKIKSLHVYDFDNTLFKTPLPNSAIWNGSSIGTLSNMDMFTDGGWWHDNRILAATGEGIDKEEPKAWKGWWNEKIVDLVRLSMKDPDALTVLLTGRAEGNFQDLIKRIAKSKKLEFDMVCLKPKVSPMNEKFQSTMHFKQLFLNALMETYKDAAELRIYEDRPKHTKGFRDFFEEWNRRQGERPTRGKIDAEVIQVAEINATLDPVREVAEVQRMVLAHNEAIAKLPTHSRLGTGLKIKKQVLFTCYHISSTDTQKLHDLAQIPEENEGRGLMYHGNSIMINPRTAPPHILSKVGGIGAKMKWEVISIGSWKDNIWAAGLRAVPRTAAFHVTDDFPLVVLATRKGTKPADAVKKIDHWYSLSSDQMFTFETTVGEKAILKIEKDFGDGSEDDAHNKFSSSYENNSRGGQRGGKFDSHRGNKRKWPGNEEERGPKPPSGPKNDMKNHQNGGRGGGGGQRGRGGSGRGFRGGGRGGRGGKGRGGGFGYRSLDGMGAEGAGQQGPGSGNDLQNYY